MCDFCFLWISFQPAVPPSLRKLTVQVGRVQSAFLQARKKSSNHKSRALALEMTFFGNHVVVKTLCVTLLCGLLASTLGPQGEYFILDG